MLLKLTLVPSLAGFGTVNLKYIAPWRRIFKEKLRRALDCMPVGAWR